MVQSRMIIVERDAQTSIAAGAYCEEEKHAIKLWAISSRKEGLSCNPVVHRDLVLGLKDNQTVFSSMFNELWTSIIIIMWFKSQRIVPLDSTGKLELPNYMDRARKSNRLILTALFMSSALNMVLVTMYLHHFRDAFKPGRTSYGISQCHLEHALANVSSNKPKSRRCSSLGIEICLLWWERDGRRSALGSDKH